MSTATDHYDVIVIGSGPAGGTTAAKLAETGKRVLLLERGDFLPRERGSWDSKVGWSEPRPTPSGRSSGRRRPRTTT